MPLMLVKEGGEGGREGREMNGELKEGKYDRKGEEETKKKTGKE
jgi:hypothetical protein